ncbi:MAG: leucine-rich repeat protein [Sanguibacteroides justesenii]|nr:leucine-rich repeat protein [Sanguibacteroides justesenii]
MKNNLFLLALATLLLVSCNKDKGNHLEDDDNVVQITASIDGTADGGTVSAGRATVDNDGEGTFDPGDTWGLYAYTTEGDYMNANTEYKYEETILYWKDLSETEAVTFSAHYPRITEEIADPAAYIYKPWNHTDDLLHATATASKGETVALTFKHLMHRLVVNLIAGDGMEGVDLSSALINSAARDGMPTMLLGVEVNLLTGAVSYNSTTDGINLSNGFNGNADWIVAPQDLTAGEEWLKITVSKDGNEDVWYYHVPADLNTAEPGNQTRLESGKRLTLNLTLKKDQQTGKTEVELTASEISGWGDGGTVTDEVAIGGAASGVTTYEALLAALKTGGTSADAPTLVTLGSDITIPAGGDYNTPSMTDNGYFKIDGGGHTLTWEQGSCYFLGNVNPTANAVYIEFANINLVQQDVYMGAVICMYNGKITLSGNVTLNGDGMIMAVGKEAALELGDGCELSYETGSSLCASIVNGATLVLNGGTTAAGAYIELTCNLASLVSYPLISVPKALTGDVHLYLGLPGVIPIAQGTGGYQLTQTDCDWLKVNPESVVSLYGEQTRKYGDKFELYLASKDSQIKLRRKNLPSGISGNINMTGMTAEEAKAAIEDALDAEFTELKLTGELSKIGMGGNWGTFANNPRITKCDLSGVTGWGTPVTLPERAFLNCPALQEVVLPNDVQVIGENAFYGCASLTAVNLSQVTRIEQRAFRGCTSLEALTLDNVAAIGLEAFFGCVSLQTLKLPKCTKFANYIVTGCSSLTRIEVTAAGNIVHIEDGDDIEHYGVFDNRTSVHSGENAFNPAKCDLVLNADKHPDTGVALPKATANGEWTIFMKWKSITFQQ